MADEVLTTGNANVQAFAAATQHARSRGDAAEAERAATEAARLALPAQARDAFAPAILATSQAGDAARAAAVTLPKFRSTTPANPAAPTQAELDANPNGIGGLKLTAEGGVQQIKWTPHTTAGAWVNVGEPGATAAQVQAAQADAENARLLAQIATAFDSPTTDLPRAPTAAELAVNPAPRGSSKTADGGRQPKLWQNGAWVNDGPASPSRNRVPSAINATREFGFVGNGAADDTAAYTAMLAEINTQGGRRKKYEWEPGSIVKIASTLRLQNLDGLTLIGEGVQIINSNAGSDPNNAAVLDFFRCRDLRIVGGITVGHPGIGTAPPLTDTDPRRTYGGAGWHFWQVEGLLLEAHARRVSNMGVILNSVRDAEVRGSSKLCMGDGFHLSNDCVGVRGSWLAEDCGDDLFAVFGLTKYPGGGAWPAPSSDWPSAAGQVMPPASDTLLHLTGRRGAARGLTLGGVRRAQLYVTLDSTRLAALNLTSGSPAQPDPADQRVGGDTALCRIVADIRGAGVFGGSRNPEGDAIRLDGKVDKVTVTQRYVEGLDLTATIEDCAGRPLASTYGRGITAQLRMAGRCDKGAYLDRSPDMVLDMVLDGCGDAAVTAVDSPRYEVGGRISNAAKTGVLAARSPEGKITARLSGNGTSVAYGYHQVELVDSSTGTTITGAVFDSGANANKSNRAVKSDASSTGTTITGGQILRGGGGNPDGVPFELLGGGRISGVGGYSPGHVAPPAAVAGAIGAYVTNPYPFPVRIAIIGGTLNDVGLRSTAGQVLGIGPQRLVILAPGEAISLFADPAPESWAWSGFQ